MSKSIKLLLAVFICFSFNISHAYEYSQGTIDSYVSSCTIGDYISQEKCECAIKYIQENLPEKEYLAAIENTLTEKEVKPETLEIFASALSAQCSK